MSVHNVQNLGHQLTWTMGDIILQKHKIINCNRHLMLKDLYTVECCLAICCSNLRVDNGC